MFVRPYYCVIGNRFGRRLFLDVGNWDNKQNLLLVLNSLQIQKMSQDKSSSSTSKSEAKNGGECNKLKSEKSPYLLQHKDNPVHWYSWGEEAFALARTKQKPIFLSVGYSTCHWCHVMEKESFEKEDVAKIMNKYFVNIKMDREERPDIDRIYMTFVQAVSGSGGWPMSVWMTPDLKPFYGGTYYPPEDRTFGRPGFKSLLLTIADQWKDNSEKFITSADKIFEVLERTASLPVNERLPNASEVSSKCLHQLSRAYEPAFGGFSESPKFPQPVNINFLIYYRKSNPLNGDALKMVDKTLRMMSKGGIHDHVGKGYCRYSTDKKWHVPHFEKMLYDNAQLANAFTNAYLLTSDSFFARQVADILEYVERDLSHDEGGFYSAEDADSYPTKDAKVKAEGAFYVWSKAETDKIFGSKKLSNGVTRLAEMFEWRYGIRDSGNVDPRQDPHDELKRKNVLYIAHTVDETAKKFSLLGDEVRTACNEAKELLFAHRNQYRPRPGLDTKFIASWNGLMISAFARAGSALDKPSYIERAVKAMNFVTNHLIAPSGQLYRTCYRDGDDNSSPITNLSEPILACVDDFANLINANLDLFDATWNLDYLRLAILLQKKQDEIFWDEEKGGYFNSRESIQVIVRFKDDDDGAEPSSNSTSVVNLIRLLSITDNERYKEKITKLFQQFADRLAKVPMTLPLMTTAYDAYTAGARLVLILKKQETKSDTVKHMRSRLLPVGSTIVGLNVDTCSNLTEWQTLVPCITEKLEHFNARDTAEIIYLRQGDRFTHTYNKDEFESMISAL